MTHQALVTETTSFMAWLLLTMPLGCKTDGPQNAAANESKQLGKAVARVCWFVISMLGHLC
jgi:hypothetical protein